MHVRCSFVVPYFVEGLPEGGNQAGRCDAENTRAQQRDVKEKKKRRLSYERSRYGTGCSVSWRLDQCNNTDNWHQSYSHATYCEHNATNEVVR